MIKRISSPAFRNGKSIVRTGSATFSMLVCMALAGALVASKASASDVEGVLVVGEPANGAASAKYHSGDQVTVTQGVQVGVGQTNGVPVTGVLTIDGGQTAFKVITGNVTIGLRGGDGALIVSNGATMNASSSGLILGDTSSGVVSKGEMKISGGSAVTSASGMLLHNATASITGENSSWTMGDLNLATDGYASMSITNGGLVNTNGDATIGEKTTSTGTPTALISGVVTVSDKGSQWTVSGDLLVGSRKGIQQYGQTGILQIENGGVVNTATFMSQGTSDPTGQAHFSDVTIDGEGSALNVIGDMAISFYSSMKISNGGIVNAGGAGIHSNLNNPTTVLVTGNGSEWNITGSLEQEGGLTVANGGKVSAGTTILLDGDTAVLNIGAASGAAATAAGFVSTPSIVNDEGKIVLNHTDTDYSLHAAISGTGTVEAYSGTTTLVGANTYTGATILYGGTLRAGGTDVFSAGSAHKVRSGATLDLAGYDQSVDTLSNAGTVWFNQGAGSSQLLKAANSGPGTVLTVKNYVGNGGTLVFNTVLGDSASATDRLVIDGGSATGSTNVIVNNMGGLGAQTTGDGILLISAVNGAKTDAATFSLQNGHISAGAYDYTLMRGMSAETGESWYLSSNLLIPMPSGGGSNGSPIIPAREDAGTGISENASSYPRAGNSALFIVVPNYRAEASLAATFAPLATEYGYAMLGTLHERVGDSVIRPMAPAYEERVIRDSRGNRAVARVAAAPQPGSEQTFFGGWARLIGDRGIHDNKNFLKSGPDYNYTFGGIQAGFDGYAREHAGSLDKVGVYVGYGQIDSDVKGVLRTKAGNVTMDALSLGGYWTHKDAQGWYTDAVVQGTWYSTDATSVRGLKLRPDAFGILASLEGGYALKLGSGLSLEPQAQLAYQNVSFDNARDLYGRFNWENTDSWRGRLGVRLAQEWNAGDTYRPVPITAWLRANLWHEFAGKGSVAISNVYGYNPALLSSPLGGTWGEIGAGISGQLTEQLSLFTTAAYNHSLDNKGREAWNGRIGATLKW